MVQVVTLEMVVLQLDNKTYKGTGIFNLVGRVVLGYDYSNAGGNGG